MANAYRGVVDIDIGDTTKQLRYSLNDLIELEDLRGKPIGELLTNGAGLGFLRDAIFVGLRYDKSTKLTRLGVGDMIDPGKIKYLSDTVARGLGLALAGPNPVVPQMAPAMQPVPTQSTGSK